MGALTSKIIVATGSVACVMALWGGINISMPQESGGGLLISEAQAAERATIIPMPRVRAPEKGKRAVAIFAGGCFWGVEGVFSHTKGVLSASSGYHGGTKRSASYRLVSAGLTSHAEAVRVVYDPSKVSYGKLMQIYFSVITDPTMLNAQGPDRGKHYRSALVPLNKAQGKAARAYVAQLRKGKYWRRPIVTRIETNKGFYRAETYHQDFIQKNPKQGYIVHWDKPKIARLKRVFPKQYRANPVS